MKIAVILLSCVPGLLAQSPSKPPVVDQQLAGVANLPSHKIMPNDLIALAVYDAPELTRTVRIGPDGVIDLPMLNRGVEAEGLTPTELEASISRALREQQIILKPIVSVTIMEYNSRYVSVVGAVRKPLTFSVVGATRLLDALARAEGTTGDAGPDLLLTRAGAAASEKISLKDLLSGTDPTVNEPLEGGEEIRIPEARKIYVVGDVKKPGAIAIRDDNDSSVLKLLALVEGVMPYASDKAYIYRALPDKTADKTAAAPPRTEIAIELKGILARKSPDVQLQPDDIMYVPDNTRKRATHEAIKNALMYGSAPLAAAIYAGAL